MAMEHRLPKKIIKEQDVMTIGAHAFGRLVSFVRSPYEMFLPISLWSAMLLKKKAALSRWIWRFV